MRKDEDGEASRESRFGENEEKSKVRASSGVVTPTDLFISRENGTPCRAMPRRQRARDVNEFDDAHYGMPELAFHNTYIASAAAFSINVSRPPPDLALHTPPPSRYAR
ncbi:hypothetical protein ALC60_01032 [Trachymyrmex zeteki]|uniref:Uncharacterized protein n=1 Tax=Mycetomoellerius zeteki TaxID=64791 RepID=A0A151XHY8_9HYME|nr:hypothetical protein ALC60_01032 [Trachymyrmex zeteki]